MKKLMMFAAAMTIVGGAFAQCAVVEPGHCAMVWSVKMNLRTVTGKASSTTTVNSQDCTVDEAALCIRYPNFAYAVQGYLVTEDCECTCDALNDATAYLWATRLKSELVVTSWDWSLHVLGKQNTAEASWVLEGTDDLIGDMTLAGAGFGTFKKTNIFGSDVTGTFTALAGTVVGTLDEPTCVDACSPAAYWFCEDLSTTDDSEPGVIFGTWNVKFSLAGSKAVANGKGLPTPKWYGL